MPARTIAELIAGSSSSFPDVPALLAPGSAPITYEELHQFIHRTTDRLLELGLDRESRCAAVLPNGPEMAGFVLSVTSVCACAPLNPRYKTNEFSFYLEDLRADVLVVPGNGAPQAEAAAGSLGLPVLRLAHEAGAPAGTFSLEGNRIASTRAAATGTGDTLALLLHTSGTTSRPKLVPLTQANLCASAMNVARTLALTPDDRCLNIMPLFHIHGLVACLLATIASGGSIVCTDGGYGSSFFNYLLDYRPTWYSAVPTMHQAILARGREFAGLDAAASLRFIRSCSAALAPTVLVDLEELFRVPVVEAYGMTEAAHQMTCNPLPPGARKPGSVGIPAGPEVAIMAPDGALLERGEAGEVVIRGDNVTSGYERNPAANSEAFSNGWFRTGDLGRFDDDGYLFLLGRKKEQINRGGEKISPREIDEVLLGHPAVAQAVAFAIPHTRLGEEVGAAVIRRPNAQVSEAELQAWAARELAEFKVPRIIRFVDDIPKGPTGKLQRIGLAAALGIGEIDETALRAEYVAPQNETEERIVEIWHRILGKETVGIRDRFSSLGGDSIAQVTMMAAVNQAFGTELAFTGFLQEDTIERMAREIALNAGPALFETIGAEGRGPALVCAPGHDNVILGLRRLIGALEPRRPAYALNFEVCRQNGATSIDKLAAIMCEQATLNNGACAPVFAGACFGGLVALEAARRARAALGVTPTVVLIDSFNRHWTTSAAPFELLRAALRQLRFKMSYHTRILMQMSVPAGARHMLERGRAFVSYHSGVHEARTNASDSGDRPLSSLLLRQSVLYSPRPWDGPVLILRTRGRRLEAPLGGWEGVLTGDVREETVAFNPKGALSRRAIDEAAAVISRYLRGVERSPGI